jgi:hypothetical protein
MTLSAPSGYVASQLIFEDTFLGPTLDTTKWNPGMGDDAFGRWTNRGALPAPDSGENSGSYQIQWEAPGQITTGSAGLLLTAKPDGTKAGYTWVSGGVSTYGGKFHIPAAGGYLQISAKMPDSRYGAWPSLWLLPSAGSDGKEFDLQEGGNYGTTGSLTANHILASHWWGGNKTQHLADAGVDLSAGYHTYGVEYVPGKSWKVFLDGKLMFTWTDGVSTNASYELIIELEMAGAKTAGWHTVADPVNHPGPFEMAVADVQVYQLAPVVVAPPPQPVPADTLWLLGAAVITAGSIAVMSRAGRGGTLCTQAIGVNGTIVAGPRTVNGVTYWFVVFASGCDGWVPQSALSLN